MVVDMQTDWCARVTFQFNFEMMVAEPLVPTRFVLHRDSAKNYFRVISGRGTKIITNVPKDKRPIDSSREWWKSEAVATTGQAAEARRVCVSNAPIFIEEIAEPVGFTVVSVAFILDGTLPTHFNNQIYDQLVDHGIGFIRQLVESYRVVSKQVDVFMPSRKDSAFLKIEVSDKFTKTENDIIGDFNQVAAHLKVEQDPRNPVAKFPLPEPEMRQLSERLMTNARLHISDELHLEAMELSFIDGNHRVALVIGGTSFETWLQNRLEYEFKLRGIAKHQLSKKTILDVAEIAETNVGSLLRDYLRYLVGSDVTTLPEYTAWKNKAYMPRNEIVHRGRTDVSADDVKSAMLAIGSFKQYLESTLTGSRPSSNSRGNP